MLYKFIVSAICVMVLVRAVNGNVVIVDGKNITLTSLCGTKDHVLQLDANVTHNLTVDCVFNNASNLTLRGALNSEFAVINCLNNGSLNFINSCNIMLYNINITNCGTANITIRRELPHKLMKQVIAALFLNCVNVNMINVTMTDNTGINFVGVNVLGTTVFDNVTIKNVTPLQSKDSDLTSSAALFQFLVINDSNPLYINKSTRSDLFSYLHITNSQFLNNINTLPDIVLDYSNSYYYYGSFSNLSTPLVAPGLSIGFLQNDTYPVSVLVNSTKFFKNHGRLGGGLLIAFANPVEKVSIIIDNCIFKENSVNKEYIQTSYGAGIIAISLFYVRINSHSRETISLKSKSKPLLTISNTNFTNNSAVIGTCIYLFMFVSKHSVRIVMENVVFSNNKGDVATGVYAEDHLSYEMPSTVNVIMTNIRAKNNELIHATNHSSNPLSDVNGMFVFFNVRNVTMNGSSNHFLNNTPGVLGLSRTDVLFDGIFSFINNTTPLDGGAIYLSADSTMIIHCNSYIHFENNRAGDDSRGGAIYSDSSDGFAELANACPIQFSRDKSNFHVNFFNNTAGRGGNAIYASQLYPCGWFPQYGHLSYNENVKEIYNKSFNFSHKVCKYHDDGSCLNITDCQDCQIASTAHRVYFCSITTKMCCRSHNISVYPGEMVELCLIMMDSKNSPVQSYVHFLPRDTNIRTIPKKANIGVCFTEVNVTLYGIPNKTVNITLRPSVPLYTVEVDLTVHFKDCPIGFTQDIDSCVCNEALKDRFCDNNSLVIPQGAWMGIIANNSLFFKLYCDVAYCQYSSHVIPFHHNSSVCRNNRDGILCGKCIEGHSVVFGSQDCHRCHNYSLISLLGYAIIGVITVIMLSVLKLTVDKGIINGVIFFANIVYINHNLYYIAKIEVLPGIFNIINLDVPTDICFYQGMDALAKYAISFIFPLYLWFLVLLTVLMIKKFSCISRVIQSPAQLLATLIYLSYSKLLLVISYILAPIQVSEIAPSVNKTIIHYRWYHDPNVAYGDPRHVVLIVASLLLFFAVLLPFAIVLTFPNYFLGFRCLVRFKPIIDSYTAPYKDRWGFWLGIHLLILIILYSSAMIQQVSSEPKDLLLIILLIVIPLTAVQLYCKPYKNKLVNLLDTLFLLNIIIGGCFILWIVREDGGLNFSLRYFRVIVYVSLGVAALEILAILLYHVMTVTSLGQSLMIVLYQLVCCKRNTRSLNSFNEQRQGYQPVGPLSYSDDEPLLKADQNVPPRFRESLLDYDNLINPRAQS